jgi:hypothetical protein
MADERVEVDGMELHLQPVDDPEGEQHTALPPRVEAWRRRSATGALLTGIALGLQEALGTKREDAPIVVQTSGDPPTDLPVEADLAGLRPEDKVVNVRPWLLPGDGE